MLAFIAKLRGGKRAVLVIEGKEFFSPEEHRKIRQELNEVVGPHNFVVRFDTQVDLLPRVDLKEAQFAGPLGRPKILEE